MKTSTIACGLSLVLPAVYGRAISDTCVNVAVLPLITVNKGPGGYENEYIRKYSAFLHGDRTVKAYTITQTCPTINCQPAPIETAPPPGFTHAVLHCNRCNGSYSQAATFTFPTESMGAYMSMGYTVSMLDLPSTSSYRQSSQGQISGGDRTCKGNCTQGNLRPADISSWLGSSGDRTNAPLYTGSIVESASETLNAPGDDSAMEQGQDASSDGDEEDPDSDNRGTIGVDEALSSSDSGSASPTASIDEEPNGRPADSQADTARTDEQPSNSPAEHETDTASTGNTPPTSGDTATSSDSDSKSPQNNHSSPVDDTAGDHAGASDGSSPPPAKVVTVSSATFSMANALRCTLMGAIGLMVSQLL